MASFREDSHTILEVLRKIQLVKGMKCNDRFFPRRESS